MKKAIKGALKIPGNSEFYDSNLQGGIQVKHNGKLPTQEILEEVNNKQDIVNGFRKAFGVKGSNASGSAGANKEWLNGKVQELENSIEGKKPSFWSGVSWLFKPWGTPKPSQAHQSCITQFSELPKISIEHDALPGDYAEYLARLDIIREQASTYMNLEDPANLLPSVAAIATHDKEVKNKKIKLVEASKQIAPESSQKQSWLSWLGSGISSLWSSGYKEMSQKEMDDTGSLSEVSDGSTTSSQVIEEDHGKSAFGDRELLALCRNVRTELNKFTRGNRLQESKSALDSGVCINTLRNFCDHVIGQNGQATTQSAVLAVASNADRSPHAVKQQLQKVGLVFEGSGTQIIRVNSFESDRLKDAFDRYQTGNKFQRNIQSGGEKPSSSKGSLRSGVLGK